MNERPIAVWIITNKEGTVLSAHCLGCKAGLAETCSHIVSILFRIEDATRINETLVCTQVKCMWLLPTYVSEVPYGRVKVLRSCYIDQCKVRSTMFNTHRVYRSSVLFGYWYELLYKETVQSFQKLGGLQSGWVKNLWWSERWDILNEWMSDQLQFGLLLIRRELCYQLTALVVKLD